MKLKKIFGELFIMTKAERNGSLVLLALLLILVLIRFVIPNLVMDDRVYLNEIEGKIAKLELQKDSLEILATNSSAQNLRGDLSIRRNESTISKRDNKSVPVIEYFKFDPNTESFTNLVKLGFSKKVANTLLRFRTSGAHFYCAEDLLKVYGIDTALYNNLLPYVAIVSDKKESNRNKLLKATPVPEIIIEVNSADSALWTTLSGIGSVFATRICDFRKLLGGYTTIEQLTEVYNLPEETYQRIKPFLTIDTTKVKKIDLNFVDVKELAKHPYCDFRCARKIIDFRVNNGSYTSAQQLLSDSLLSEGNFVKLLPYLMIK